MGRRDVKPLTWRQWRWTWLCKLLHVTALIVLIVPWLVLYLPARGIVAAFDAFGSWLDSVHVRLHNRDLARKNGLARRPGEARPDGWLP
jgi:hypothetical protein